jgi:hypothetical protein
MKNSISFRVVAIVAIISISALFSGFKSDQLKTNHSTIAKAQTFDGGYFVLSGQEYHVYTDVVLGTVTALYKSVGGVDQTAIATFAGHEYSGSGGALSVYINFTDGGSKFYNGLVYY